MWANLEVKQGHSGEARKAGPTGAAQAVEGEGDKSGVVNIDGSLQLEVHWHVG